MKAVTKIIASLFLAVVCAGYVYARHAAEDAKFEMVIYHDVVRQGDTFNSILSNYYNPYNEEDCWDDWQAKCKLRNKRLFTKPNGAPRALMPGDIICIQVRERVAR